MFAQINLSIKWSWANVEELSTYFVQIKLKLISKTLVIGFGAVVYSYNNTKPCHKVVNYKLGLSVLQISFITLSEREDDKGLESDVVFLASLEQYQSVNSISCEMADFKGFVQMDFFSQPLHSGKGHRHTIKFNQTRTIIHSTYEHFSLSHLGASFYLFISYRNSTTGAAFRMTLWTTFRSFKDHKVGVKWSFWDHKARLPVSQNGIMVLGKYILSSM